jgi:hypothetical protein
MSGFALPYIADISISVILCHIALTLTTQKTHSDKSSIDAVLLLPQQLSHDILRAIA